MGWITKNGHHIWVDEDTTIVSQHSGDEITTKMALEGWAKNSTGIKAASKGEKYTGALFGAVGMNDEAKAQLITQFVKGHKINKPIYRGIKDVSEKDYKKYTKVGSEVSEKGLASWSLDKGTAVGRGANGITFVKDTPTTNANALGNRTGTDIEQEVIVLDHKAKVTKVEKAKHTTFVYLR